MCISHWVEVVVLKEEEEEEEEKGGRSFEPRSSYSPPPALNLFSRSRFSR